MFCAKCGVALADGAAFCSGCGQQVNAAVHPEANDGAAASSLVNTPLPQPATLPKVIGVLTILQIIYCVIIIPFTIWTIQQLSTVSASDATQFRMQTGVELSSFVMIQYVALAIAALLFVFSIYTRRLKAWAYWGLMGLAVASLLQQFSPYAAQTVNQMSQYSSQSGIQLNSMIGASLVFVVLYLTILGANYKSFMQAAQYAEANQG